MKGKELSVWVPTQASITHLSLRSLGGWRFMPHSNLSSKVYGHRALVAVVFLGV